MAATRRTSQGKTHAPPTRTTVIARSSSGCRIASRASRRNSAISSRKSAPRCASDISPGTGRAPPPTRPGAEIPWCGARNGGVRMSPAPVGKRARDRMHPRDLERLAVGERSEDPGQASREHRLAGARRSGQKQVMPSRRRDLGGAARHELAAQIREVGRGRRRGGLGVRPRQRRDRASPEEMRRGVREVRHGDDPDPVDRGGLAGARRGQHDLGEPGVPGGESEAQRSANRPDLAAEPELSDDDAAAGGSLTSERGEAQGDRQIERGAGFSKVRRGQVDRDRPRWKREARVLQGGADALSRFADSGVGESDDREAGETARGVDLDVEHTGFEAESRGGVDPGEHATSSGPRRPDRMRTRGNGNRRREARRVTGSLGAARLGMTAAAAEGRLRGHCAGILSLSPGLISPEPPRPLMARISATVVPCRRAIW